MMRVKMRMNDEVEAEIRAWKNDGFPEGISKTLAKFIYMSLSTPLPEPPDDLELDTGDPIA